MLGPKNLTFLLNSEFIHTYIHTYIHIYHFWCHIDINSDVVISNHCDLQNGQKKTNLTLCLFPFFQINIDHETRDITKANMQALSPSCFDMAQHRIYMLMAKDCYPRFLRSPSYRDLVCQAKPSTKATKQGKKAWKSPHEMMENC